MISITTAGILIAFLLFWCIVITWQIFKFNSPVVYTVSQNMIVPNDFDSLVVWEEMEAFLIRKIDTQKQIKLVEGGKQLTMTAKFVG